MSVDTTTPIECIAIWAAQLKARGFDDKIKAEHWFEEWMDRKHVTLNGADGSILEITYQNVYTRVVAAFVAQVDKPFAFYRYASTRYAERPKTEFHLCQLTASYRSRQEVSTLLADYLF